MRGKLDRIDPVALSSNPRASQAAWLKYRDVVIAAYKHYPKPYIYCPASMTPATVCSRVRDAIRGKLAFDYPESEVSNGDLARWYDQIVIKHDNVRIYIGQPEEIRSNLIGHTPSASQSSHLKFPTLTFEEIAAFTLLISSGRLLVSIEIEQPPDISLLPKRPNVEIMPRKDGSLVIL